MIARSGIDRYALYAIKNKGTNSAATKTLFLNYFDFLASRAFLFDYAMAFGACNKKPYNSQFSTHS